MAKSLRVALFLFIALISFLSVRFFANVGSRPLTVSGAYEAIQEGMSEREVTDIIGYPPGEYAEAPELKGFGSLGRAIRPPRRWVEDQLLLEWTFYDCEIWVRLENGRVVSKQREVFQRDEVGNLFFRLAHFSRWLVR